jgi:hypothetical protein
MGYRRSPENSLMPFESLEPEMQSYRRMVTKMATRFFQNLGAMIYAILGQLGSDVN